MPAEISLPVHVRIGATECCWGDLTVEAVDGAIREEDVRHQVAAFFREVVAVIESPSDDEEVPDAAAHG